jgi:ornithine--oxo-acid transaminase
MVMLNGTSQHTAMNGTQNGGSKPSHQGANGTNGHSNQNGTLSSQACIDLEHDYSAHNYHPMPVVFSKAKGARVWNPEGKEYIDCLSAYSAVNQVSRLEAVSSQCG